MLDPPILDKRRWWTREDIVVLALIGILYLLPGLWLIPLFDRDEPRFAVAARTMLETGDYIVPKFNGALRPDKPPLVYWLMDLGYSLTGGYNELGARLPSVVCATLTLLVIYFMTGSRFGRLTGFVAALMYGSCALFIVEGRLATADSTMILFISICMACAWKAYDVSSARQYEGRFPRADFLLDRSGDRELLFPFLHDHVPPPAPRAVSLFTALIFWIALAAGTMAKGVPLVFVLVPMIVLSVATGALPEELKKWRSHFSLSSARVMVALAAAVAMVIFLLAGSAVPALYGYQGLGAIIGAVVVAMALTPRLPGVVARCIFHGNWAWWKRLRPMIGVPLLIVLVGWWVVWAGTATHWQLISDMVGNHFLNRSMGPLLHSLGIHITDTTTGGTEDAMKNYGQPPGFYLGLVWGTFWPWSILIVPTAYHTLRRLRGKTAIAIDPRPYQFLLVWIVPMWILLELARGKLPHYPLPLYIPLAILCADTLVQSWNRLTDVLDAPWFAVMRWGFLAICAVGGIALLVIARRHPDAETFVWRCFPFALCLIATGIASAISWARPSWPFVLVLAWGGTLLTLSTLLLPNVTELQVSPIAGRLMAYARHRDPSVKLGEIGYEEASLVFYSGTNVRRFGSVDELLKTVDFSGNPDATHYVVAVEEEFRKKLDDRGVKYIPLARQDIPENLQHTDANAVRGNNTTTLKPVVITLITNRPFESATTTQASSVPATSQPASSSATRGATVPE